MRLGDTPRPPSGSFLNLFFAILFRATYRLKPKVQARVIFLAWTYATKLNVALLRGKDKDRLCLVPLTLMLELDLQGHAYFDCFRLVCVNPFDAGINPDFFV